MSEFTIAPDGARIVKLEAPIQGHNGAVNEIKLRAPTYADFMALGDPTTLIVAANSMVPMDDLPTIRGYIERLSDQGEILLKQCSLADAIALRDATKSFFSARSRDTSTTSPTP